MLTRRALSQFAAAAVLLVLGFSALVALVAESPGAGASPSSAPRPAPKPSADSRTPYGEMNLAWSEPGMIGVVGWAKDPDVNRPIDVVVAIDRGMWVRPAGVYNPYLPGKYNEKFRSYLVAIPVEAGPHTMCVAALNVGPGNPFRLLGCKVFDHVESGDPTGTLESVTLLPSGDGVRAGGWAVDRNTSGPVAVDLTVDGAVAGRVLATADRPDVGAAFPGSGSGHGFGADLAVTPGPRRICAIARNYDRGNDATIGCSTIDVPRSTPFGLVEVVAPGDNTIDVRGWAGDPAPLGPVNVMVAARLVGGVDDAAATAVPAIQQRPDVAAVTGLDPRAGFAASIPVSTAGAYDVCVTAVNNGVGRDEVIGCRTISVDDRRLTANVERVQPQSSGVSLSGWAFDPDAAGSSASVRVTVDGAPTTATANISRPDVAGAVPGAGPATGFSVTIGGLSAGRHSVCVTLLDLAVSGPGLRGDRALPCGSVIVGTTALGTRGTAGPPAIVGPPGGPLSDIDRDAGLSVTLRDGSQLWLFGDSTAYAGDSLKYFVGGTAAWASAAEPHVTRDASTAGGAPYLMAAPGGGFPACSPSRPNRVMWPVSAFKVAEGGRDRVVAFFANMCIATMNDYEFRGLAVGQWYYDPASPPAYQPIQFEIFAPSVAQTRAFGTASVFDPVSGFAYLYACDRPTNPLDIGGYGPCRVARVNPLVVGNPSQYQYFNGSSWVAGEGNAQPIQMPQGASAITRYPAAAFTVVFDPSHGVYVMAYSPWPGFVDRTMVRISRTPQGPWSEPVEVAFPGCNDTVGGQTKGCYAATPQPAFSTSTELGLGYYDQAVPADRRRGRYVVTRVPFSVVLS